MTLARLFVSPHLDDVAFSCGATVASAVASGERCLVLTVCSEGPEGEKLSEVAQALHARWGGGQAAELARRRQREDEAASTRLGVAAMHLGLRDCIYRRAPSGAWRIGDDAEVFEGIKAEDAPLVERLLEALRALQGVDDRTEIHGPLAIGGHVDHELCRHALERWRPAQLRYYEDFPYCLQAGRLDAALGPRSRWSSYLRRVSGAHLRARIEAASCYQSQLPFLFGDAPSLEAKIREQAGALGEGAGGWAERFWEPADPSDPPRLQAHARGHLAAGGHGAAGTRL